LSSRISPFPITDAAAAALAAHAQAKFWEFHNKLFESYRSLSDSKILEIAKELGLDMQRFNKDIRDPAVQRLIFRDVRDARQAGVRATPTVLINGKLLKNRSLPGFQQMIENELRKP
jgi:predicted DsbA family dithiol-disulfide isomerase